MDLLRKILTLLLAALVLVIIVLAARWTGEKIRERFLQPAKPPITVYQPGITSTNITTNSTKTATYSAIPKTGPEEFGLVMTAISMLGGISSLVLARKKT